MRVNCEAARGTSHAPELERIDMPGKRPSLLGLLGPPPPLPLLKGGEGRGRGGGYFKIVWFQRVSLTCRALVLRQGVC